MTFPRPTLAVDLRALVPEATGIGVYTRALVLELARRGRFRVIGMAHRPVRGAEELREAGVALESHPAPLGVLWQQARLPWRLRRGDVDLFWSPLNTLPRFCPVPAVVTVHDLTVLSHGEKHRRKVRWSQLPFLRSTLRAARAVAADSEATARDVAAYHPAAAEKVRVIYPGVDPAFRPAPARQVAAFREELGCPEGYVLYAGTLEPRKNLGVLLDAWELYRKHAREAALPLVLAGGYGWGSEALVERLRELEAAEDERVRVRVLGRLPRQRLVEVVQAARVFAYPSLYEGFGLPPAEAMACGVPTVVSRSSSLPEVVGEAGLTVDPGRPDELAAALARLTGAEGAARFGPAGAARSRRFTWERAADAFEELFAAVLAGGDGFRPR